MRRLAPTNVALLIASAKLLRGMNACEPLADVTRTLKELYHTGVAQSALREVEQWSALCRPVGVESEDGSAQAQR